MSEGFEVYNEKNQLMVSSQWPTMNMYTHQKNSQIILQPYNYYYAELKFPERRRTTGMLAFRPRTLGCFVDIQGWQEGPYGDTWQIGIRVGGQTWNSVGIPGAVDIYMFDFHAIPSGERFGLQTYDENGKLTFDSEATSLKIIKQVKFEDMTFLGGQPTGSGDGYAWFFGITWPLEADAIIETSMPSWTAGGEGSGGNWGFLNDMNTLVYSYVWRTSWGGPQNFRTPSLMFCRITKKLE